MLIRTALILLIVASMSLAINGRSYAYGGGSNPGTPPYFKMKLVCTFHTYELPNGTQFKFPKCKLVKQAYDSSSKKFDDRLASFLNRLTNGNN